MRLPGKRLSQAGVSLARRVGHDRGPFNRVVTSELARAYETAIAMGFAVDARSRLLSNWGADPFVGIDPSTGFAAVAAAVRRGGEFARFADAQLGLWRSIVSSLPEGGQGLVVTHGGFVEAGTVAALPDLDFESWGGWCRYCEGVRLAYDGQRFADAELLRVEASVE